MYNEREIINARVLIDAEQQKIENIIFMKVSIQFL